MGRPPFEVRVSHRDEEIDGLGPTVRAYGSGVPGLLIHRDIVDGKAWGDAWTITHEASGCAVSRSWPTLREAREALRIVHNRRGRSTDWTLSTEAIRRRPTPNVWTLEVYELDRLRDRAWVRVGWASDTSAARWEITRRAAV